MHSRADCSRAVGSWSDPKTRSIASNRYATHHARARDAHRVPPSRAAAFTTFQPGSASAPPLKQGATSVTSLSNSVVVANPMVPIVGCLVRQPLGNPQRRSA